MKWNIPLLVACLVAGVLVVSAPVSAAYPGWDFHMYPYHYGNLSGQLPMWINQTQMHQMINTSPDLHHYNYEQAVKEVTTNQYQNNMLGNYLWSEIDQVAQGDDQARVAFSIVRKLPSMGTFEERAVGPYQFQYPYVSFGYTSSGVCSDRSIALAWLLSRQGYDSCILWFTGGQYGSHMATGIRVNDAAPYNFNKTGYALIEISNPVPPTAAAAVDSGSVTVIKVGNGTKRMDLSREYTDGLRWAWLQNNYHYLNETQQQEFADLIAYYGC